MRRLTTFLTICLALALALPVSAKKPRKLSIGAYISGAKIAFGQSGNDAEPRYEDAIYLLDSCLMWYGSIPEAYYWKARVYSELAKNHRTDTAAHLGYIDSLVVAADSLNSSCDDDNKDVKKKYKEDCGDWTSQVDTLRIGWFGEYYDEAQAARKTVQDELKPNLAQAELEAEKEALQAEIDEKYEEAIRNYNRAGRVFPSDVRYLINLAQVHTERGNFAEALPLQMRAATETRKRDPGLYLNLLVEVGFSYYQQHMFDSAANVYKIVVGELTDAEMEQKVLFTNNIIACYNSLKQFDSSLHYTHKVLEMDPNDAEALSTVGRHWFAMIQDVNKAKTDAAEAGDNA
ncbi:MAG TPA: hypothetical protein VLB27_09270, partial [candidate division Zixibacteria bacterium]|nr:hypothetical protein [candidate division Zixibacteria bacterium]